MWLRLLVSWAVIAVAFYLTTRLVPGLHVTGGVVGLLLVAAVFGLVNAVVGPVLRALSLPFRMMTFGLAALIVNVVLLLIVVYLVPQLTVDGILTAIVAALVLSVLSAVLDAVAGAATRVAR